MIVLVDDYIWETLWGRTEDGTELCGTAADGAWSEKVYNIEFTLSHQ